MSQSAALAEPTADIAQDTAETPQPRSIPPQLARYAFTSENARLFNAKSQEAKRQRINEAPQPAQADSMQGQREEFDIVCAQIKRAVEVLNDRNYEWCPACERAGLQPHHRAQLLKALDALLDRKRILSGIPLPGSRKPAQERARRNPLIVLPQDEEHQPQQVQPEPVSKYWDYTDL